MGFTKNFNYCMEQYGYSAYRFAKIIGANNQSVVNWLYGSNVPHPKTRQKIAAHFGITLAELDGDELPTFSKKDEKKAPGINAEGFVPTMNDWEEQAENWTDDQILEAMQKLVEIQQRRRNDGR